MAPKGERKELAASEKDEDKENAKECSFLSMFVLDSDYLSLLDLAESKLGNYLRGRMNDTGFGEFATTIVNFEEQTRGWMAFAARTTGNAKLIDAYRRLERHLRLYCSMPVLSFDENAAIRFQSFKNAKIRVGTMDLRIAAIAVSRDATLLSRNLIDFRRVPGLKVEDWTLEYQKLE
jgi:tRNA(fMet)-specific endonuclease VapC